MSRGPQRVELKDIIIDFALAFNVFPELSCCFCVALGLLIGSLNEFGILLDLLKECGDQKVTLPDLIKLSMGDGQRILRVS